MEKVVLILLLSVAASYASCPDGTKEIRIKDFKKGGGDALFRWWATPFSTTMNCNDVLKAFKFSPAENFVCTGQGDMAIHMLDPWKGEEVLIDRLSFKVLNADSVDIILKSLAAPFKVTETIAIPDPSVWTTVSLDDAYLLTTDVYRIELKFSGADIEVNALFAVVCN